MKKIILTISLLFVSLMFFAQVSETFDGWTDGSYGGISTYNGWKSNKGLTETANARSGKCVRLQNSSGSYLEYEGVDGNGKDGGVGTISFWYRSWDSSPAAVYDVQASINGAAYVNIGSQISTTSTTYAQWSYDLNNSSDNIKIKVIRSSGERLKIDDFFIDDYSTNPTITTSKASLTGYTYVVGNGPSAEQTYNVEGTNLTADITITPPTDWEISLASGGSFSATNPITLTQSGGDVNSTAIYTRLKSGLGVNSYSGDITHTSTGATQVDVAVDGTVTDVVGWANLESQEDVTITAGDVQEFTAVVWKSGVTDSNGQGAGIDVWFGYSTTDNDPTDSANDADWTWVVANYKNDDGANNDRYYLDLGAVLTTPATYYVVSRFQMGTGPYKYGGYNGNFWEHTYTAGGNNKSGRIIVNEALVDWCNLQNPSSGAQNLGGVFDVDSRVYDAGRTNGAGQGTGIQAWIGISMTDATAVGDFTSSDWTWIPSTYTSEDGNNDRFNTDIMSGIYAAGTYYYVSRFQVNSGEYSYGGTNSDGNGGGNFWDGTNYISGVLTVTNNTCDQLIISEYANFNPGNYVEIYNPTASSIDLSNYQLWRAYNGGAWSGADIITLSGNIAAGDVYTIARTSAQVPLSDLQNNDMNYNGDDNIGLAYNGGSGTNFILIDAVGDDGGDPGTGWDVAGIASATRDYTLVRKSSVNMPTTDWTASAGTTVANSEWTVRSYSQDFLTYHVSDCVNTPEIEIVGNDNIIYSGDITPSTTDDTDFGSVVGADTVSHTFTLNNLGNTALGSIVASVTGTNPADFTISTAPPATVSASSSVTFVVTFNPTAIGSSTATISIANDDTNENPYTFDVTGESEAMNIFCDDFEDDLSEWTEVNIDGDGEDVIISSTFGGANSTSNAALFDAPYDPNTYYTSSLERTFTNVSDLTLDFSYYFEDYRGGQVTIYLDGTEVYNIYTESGHHNGTDEQISSSEDDMWHSYSLDLTGSTGTVADYTIKIVGESKTDSGADPTWKDRVAIDELCVYGNTPEIKVIGNNTNITSDVASVPDTADDTDFGWVLEDGGTAVHTFTIQNIGTLDLTLSSSPTITIGGTNAADFTLSTAASSTITSGNTSDFVITFDPSAVGVRTATVSIANNDLDENPFVFNIKGTGSTYLPCTLQDIQLILEEFDDTAGYTTSEAEWISGGDNYFTHTTANGIVADFNNVDGSFFAVQDAGDNIKTLEISDIDITDMTNLDFTVFIAEDDSNDGNEDWDTDTAMHIDYRIDGGSWENLLWVESRSSSSANTEPAIDNNFNGLGDAGYEITDTFTEFNRGITGIGDILDIRIQFRYFSGGDEDIAIDNLEIYGDGPVITTWDGVSWKDRNGDVLTPSITTKAVIDADYNTSINGGSISTCECQINTGNTLTVAADQYIEIGSDIQNDGTIEVLHEGSLVQYNDLATLSGTGGTYKIHKTTTTYAEYDYTYWSSPVDNETIGSVFAANPSGYIYSLNTANFSDADGDTFDDDGNDWETASGVMAKGVGYIAMGEGSFTTPLNSPPYNTQTQSVIFDGGKVNNGIIDVPVVLDGYTYSGTGTDYSSANTEANLIGNPYPSAIDIVKLTLLNPGIMQGTYFFWTHDDPIGSGANTGPDAYNFSNDDYSTVTVDLVNGNFSATASSNATGTGAITASRYVASGQGFLANVLVDNANVRFTNAMRVINDDLGDPANTHFLRQANNIEETTIDRLWLNLTKEDQGIFRQILVGFYDTATDDYQDGQDGQRMENGSNTDFYSLIAGENRHFAIQNLATFNDSKTVALGIEIVEAGTYEINIDHMEGVFTNGQAVYLEDTLEGIIHDFANGAYSFSTEAGESIEDRFVLRFNNDALSLDDNDILGTIRVYPNPSSSIFNISLQSHDILEIEVYNSVGNLVKRQFTDNQIDLSGFAKGIYFAKLHLNGKYTVKKLVLK